MAMTPEGADFPTMAGGTGDHMTAMAGAGGAVAALLARERTGRGQHVTTSLLRTGLFMIGCDLIRALRMGDMMEPKRRDDAANPLYNWYRTSDGRWLFLLGLQPLRHLPSVAAAVGMPELTEDPRFSTMDALDEHHTELIKILDQAFAQRTFDAWEQGLDAAGVWWTPVRSPLDVVSDAQAQAAGAFVETPVVDGVATTVASPVDFFGTPWVVQRRAPETGEQTEELLLELGYTWDDITALQDRGAFG
jgi:crotonobetainyl-CoA:carnitine CoA-transferase CaiB-like acyl-CoA transferase